MFNLSLINEDIKDYEPGKVSHRLTDIWLHCIRLYRHYCYCVHPLDCIRQVAVCLWALSSWIILDNFIYNLLVGKWNDLEEVAPTPALTRLCHQSVIGWVIQCFFFFFLNPHSLNLHRLLYFYFPCALILPNFHMMTSYQIVCIHTVGHTKKAHSTSLRTLFIQQWLLINK